MSGLEIHLLGRFYTNSSTVKPLETQKVKELLCFLLLHRDRSHSREVLAGLLWNGDCVAKSRSYLRKTLWQLQSIFTPPNVSLQCSVLEVNSDWITLRFSNEIWLDIYAFEQVFQQMKSLPGKDLRDEQACSIKEALRFYQGDLLEGWYQDWCLCERERFQYMYLAMMDKLIDYYEAKGAYAEGIAHSLHILNYDRAHERTHRKLMRLYYLAGDRTSALRQYHTCAKILEAELDVEPTKRTAELFEQIKSDTWEKLSAAKIASNPNDAINFVAQLEHVEKALVKLQKEIREEIHLLQERQSI